MQEQESKFVDRADEGAREPADLLQIVYDKLRGLAERRLVCEAPNHTLQPTALVHEVYLRLIGPDGEAGNWANEAHFFGAAAQAMRRILIDRARAKGAQKRGGGVARVELVLEQIALDDVPHAVLDLDDALQKLATEEPEKAELVTLRFFAGLSSRQAAAVLGISKTTADRYWSYSRAWLLAELRRES